MSDAVGDAADVGASMRSGVDAGGVAALAELYRDPVYDGATDPVVVIDADRWWMFYTQRRATHPDPGPGVAWVHGSRIGVAHSPDGIVWEYAGTLEPAASTRLVLTPGAPPDPTDRTHWAPEVIHDGTRWRMYLTEIDGVPDRWPGHARHIVEYVSDDLTTWTRRGPLALVSDRVIDAAVARTPDGRWRLWYKDEAADSVTKAAVSADLDEWADEGAVVRGRAHEGPSVFELGGYWWLIVDEWRGMGVYRSADTVAWQRQGGPDAVILGAGQVPGPGFGHHGAPVVDEGRVWFYFFGHPARAGAPDTASGPVAAVESADGREAADAADEGEAVKAADGREADPPADEGGAVDDRRCAVYRVELVVDGGTLRVEPALSR